MDPFTMAMLGMGGLSTILSLIQGKKASKTALESTAPGARPGTISGGNLIPEGGNFGIPALDNNQYNSDLYRMVNAGAQYDPQVAGLLAYGQGRESSVRPYLEENKSNIQNSGLSQISDRFGTEANRASDVRDQNRTDRMNAIAGYSARGNDLTGRVKALGEETTGRFRKLADDPTVFNQNEIDAMVGNVIANSQASFAGAQANAQADAVRRGRSSDATAALGTVLGESQRASQEQGVRDVMIQNALAREARKQFATGGLSSAGQGFLGLEGQIGLGYDNLDLAARGAMDNSDLAYSGLVGDLLKSQFGTQATYQDMLGGANTALANFNDTQSALPASIAELIAARSDYDTLLKSGAYDAAANRWGQLGGGFLEMGAADRNARAQAQAQRDAANSALFGDIFGSSINTAGTLGAAGILAGSQDGGGLNPFGLFGSPGF